MVNKTNEHLEAKLNEDSDENIYNLDRHLDASIESGVIEEFCDADEPADHLGEQDEQPAQPTNTAMLLMIMIITMMPTTLMATRAMIVTMPPMELYGNVLSAGQNTAR